MSVKRLIKARNVIIFSLVLPVLLIGSYVLFSNSQTQNITPDENKNTSETASKNEGSFISDYFLPKTKTQDGNGNNKSSESSDFFRASTITPTIVIKNSESTNDKPSGEKCPIDGVSVDEGTVISGETCVVESSL